MPSNACKYVQDELMFLGDILSIGIVRKGLEKVGSDPNTATPAELSKALDVHIESAIVTFIGPAKARKTVLKLKDRLARMGAN
jgi:hypothetical protein